VVWVSNADPNLPQLVLVLVSRALSTRKSSKSAQVVPLRGSRRSFKLTGSGCLQGCLYDMTPVGISRMRGIQLGPPSPSPHVSGSRANTSVSAVATASVVLASPRHVVHSIRTWTLAGVASMASFKWCRDQGTKMRIFHWSRWGCSLLAADTWYDENFLALPREVLMSLDNDLCQC